jgi:hypothetical protein
MSRLGERVNRGLVWFHRWAGVALCLVFAMWFASGAVLHFVGFPSLSVQEQRAAADPIEASRILTAPGVGCAQAGARECRLASVAGWPVYLSRTAEGPWQAVAADTGEPLPPLAASLARAVAESFGRAPVAGVVGPLNYDQWIVHQRFDPYRPMFRVRLNDADATDLYVSSRSGEVVQRTRSAERAWNWAGAVIHWIYFTPLRKSWPAWNQTVWWLSLIALLSSAAGAWLGVQRTLANRSAGRAGFTPYRGWMRWHHLIGLFASVVVIAWILSGWLSMDHGRLFSRGEASSAEIDRLRGMSTAAMAAAVPLEMLRSLPASTAIGVNALGGRPFLTLEGPGDAEPRIVFVNGAIAPASVPGSGSGSPASDAAVPEALLEASVQAVWPGARPQQTGDAFDPLYRRAESTGEDAAGFETADGTRLYVDRHSGRLLAVMDASRRRYAWIYYALHTLQFPGLIEHPAARTAAVLLLLSFGFAFSVTGVVLSWVRLRRDFA